MQSVCGCVISDLRQRNQRPLVKGLRHRVSLPPFVSHQREAQEDARNFPSRVWLQRRRAHDAPFSEKLFSDSREDRENEKERKRDAAVARTAAADAAPASSHVCPCATCLLPLLPWNPGREAQEQESRQRQQQLQACELRQQGSERVRVRERRASAVGGSCP